MDLVGYNKKIFDEIVNKYTKFLQKINITPKKFIPVSGKNGCCIAKLSKCMSWYNDNTVFEVLDCFVKKKPLTEKPLRLPIQDIYKFSNDKNAKRIIVGKIESGNLKIGDKLIFLPSGKKISIKTIESFNTSPPKDVKTDYPIGFTTDEQIYVTRGEIATKIDDLPPTTTTQLKINIFWLGKNFLRENQEYYLKLCTNKVSIYVKKIICVINTQSLKRDCNRKNVKINEIAECIISLRKPIAADTYCDNYKTGRFVIIEDYSIVGGGIIIDTFAKLSHRIYLNNICWQNNKISYKERCQRLKQQGLVIWFTGIPASGKSTLAMRLEQKLFKDGYITYTLDGDNVRHGLNSDLGFSRQDRKENIRRIAEVANILKGNGIIVLVACIAPYADMRKFAKQLIGKECFIEIYTKASVEVCKKRDPKGLYKKVNQNEIANFTGIDGLYEKPIDPNIIIDTESYNPNLCIDQIVKYLYNHKL